LPIQTTATRLWKRLTPAERLEAATEFWREPPEEMVANGLAALAKARHMRPQTVRALAADEKARALAQVLDAGEPLAGALVVALHLGGRRALLAAFLTQLGIPHEDGVLKEEASEAAAPTPEQIKSAVKSLVERFPPREIETYLNALWLQDPGRWGALEKSDEWITERSPAGPTPDRR
jgi:hypothetical protein